MLILRLLGGAGDGLAIMESPHPQHAVLMSATGELVEGIYSVAVWWISLAYPLRSHFQHISPFTFRHGWIELSVSQSPPVFGLHETLSGRG